MRKKYVMMRFFAFVADYYIVSILLGMFLSTKTVELLEELSKLTQGTVFLYDEYTQELITKVYFSLANDSLYILLFFIIYYVLLTKAFSGRTLGCVLFRQKVVKTDGSKLSLSDLTVKMLFTNGGIMYLVICLILFAFSSDIILTSFLISFIGLMYFIFVIVNVIFLFTNGTSLVDMMSKTKPLLVLKVLPKKN